MEDTAQFVCDLNVARFVEKLWSERDPDTRVSLKKLLVEEEDKFGRRSRTPEQPSALYRRRQSSNCIAEISYSKA